MESTLVQPDGSVRCCDIRNTLTGIPLREPELKKLRKDKPKRKASDAKVPNLDGFNTVEEAFKSVEKLIWHTCFQFQAQYGGDIEELFQESCYWFIHRTIPTYKVEKNRSFSSWTRMRVYRHLLDITREKARKNARRPKHESADVAEPVKDRRHFDLRELKLSLSRDAAVVIHMTCCSFGEVHEAVVASDIIPDFESKRKPKPEIAKATIVHELLTTWEWTAERIQTAFKEISEAL